MKRLQENMRRFKTKNLNEQEIDYSINPDTGESLLDKGYENLQPGDIITGKIYSLKRTPRDSDQIYKNNVLKLKVLGPKRKDILAKGVTAYNTIAIDIKHEAVIINNARFDIEKGDKFSIFFRSEDFNEGDANINLQTQKSGMAKAGIDLRTPARLKLKDVKIN